MRSENPQRLFRVAVSPLSVLVPTGGSQQILSRTQLHEKFLTIDSLVILNTLAALALLGTPNERNYLSLSTMRILQEMTISSCVRRHCAHDRQKQIQPRYNCLGMNRFRNLCLGCSIADVAHCTFHFLASATPPVWGERALLRE
jgi:hypothetical protein